MKKIRNEKLSLQKTSIVELNSLQMHTIYGGTNYNTGNDPITVDNETELFTSNPRNTFTTCSSVKTTSK
ncbi:MULTISPECIES: class I lanthipeptide [unclassified Flavobacterium]|uniref:class I lanthipeptide n=1 Tax=unclassified Flavobacterium TaxID=196869 RepID=UPI0036075713